jgi:hypothetical protein
MQACGKPGSDGLGQLPKRGVLLVRGETLEHLGRLRPESDESTGGDGGVGLHCPLRVTESATLLTDRPHLIGRERLYQNAVKMNPSGIDVLGLRTPAQIVADLTRQSFRGGWSDARGDSARVRVFGGVIGHFITY